MKNCCECHVEIKEENNKIKLWYGELLPICYKCWSEMMESNNGKLPR